MSGLVPYGQIGRVMIRDAKLAHWLMSYPIYGVIRQMCVHIPGAEVRLWPVVPDDVHNINADKPVKRKPKESA